MRLKGMHESICFIPTEGNQRRTSALLEIWWAFCSFTLSPGWVTGGRTCSAWQGPCSGCMWQEYFVSRDLPSAGCSSPDLTFAPRTRGKEAISVAPEPPSKRWGLCTRIVQRPSWDFVTNTAPFLLQIQYWRHSLNAVGFSSRNQCCNHASNCSPSDSITRKIIPLLYHVLVLRLCTLPELSHLIFYTSCGLNDITLSERGGCQHSRPLKKFKESLWVIPSWKLIVEEGRKYRRLR